MPAVHRDVGPAGAQEGSMSPAQRHMALVAAAGCVIGNRFGGCEGRVTVHHVAEGSGLRSDFAVVGLCEEHHQGGGGLHGMSPRAFCRIYRPPGECEWGLLAWVNEDIQRMSTRAQAPTLRRPAGAGRVQGSEGILRHEGLQDQPDRSAASRGARQVRAPQAAGMGACPRSSAGLRAQRANTEPLNKNDAMSQHSTIVDAIKAAEECGDGHGEFWKNWLTPDAERAHRANESFTGHYTRDSWAMTHCEFERSVGITPKLRVFSRDRLWEKEDE